VGERWGAENLGRPAGPGRPSVSRLLLASAAIVAAAALAGCDKKIPNPSGRHMQPLSAEILAELEAKRMTREGPILIRVFKEESELELWKVDKSGRFALLRTYPICRWSGSLGPKFQEGDGQAPEGFYAITPNLMNPRSAYHLAINTGFPNAHDRANGRSGSALMIHGDCASVGCYAMTDEQISEIYSLAREAFFGGQRSFQVQAYPFRMTPLNMARHRDSPHLPFWKVLKQGYDHFEVTRKEPNVAVCDRRYVFDAQSSGNFNPVGRCPAYKLPQQIASAVADKQSRDESETAELISRGIPAASAEDRGDGGMHPVFLAALRAQGGWPVTAIPTEAGTIPAHVRVPADWIADAFVIPDPEPQTVKVRVAAAVPSRIRPFFGQLLSPKPGSPTAAMRESSATQPAQTKSQAADAAPGEAPAQTKPVVTTRETPATQRTRYLIGALPIVSAGNLENRFGAQR
jgi:murein L,D-transpeptidase YafK